MMRRSLAVFAVLIGLSGCDRTIRTDPSLVEAEKMERTPDEIVGVRSQYVVGINGWTLEVAAPAEGAPAEATTGTAIEAAEAEPSGEETDEDIEETPRSATILFDILVQFNGAEPLDGLTLDLVHHDGPSKEAEKGRYHHYVETAGMMNTDVKQVDVRLEGLPYEDGDTFEVSLPAGVPADLSRYREFKSP